MIDFFKYEKAKSNIGYSEKNMNTLKIQSYIISILCVVSFLVISNAYILYGIFCVSVIPISILYLSSEFISNLDRGEDKKNMYFLYYIVSGAVGVSSFCYLWFVFVAFSFFLSLFSIFSFDFNDFYNIIWFSGITSSILSIPLIHFYFKNLKNKNLQRKDIIKKNQKIILDTEEQMSSDIHTLETVEYYEAFCSKNKLYSAINELKKIKKKVLLDYGVETTDEYRLKVYENKEIEIEIQNS